MKSLTHEAFEKTISNTIKENPDFLLIAGDLFHTAIPGIDSLKVAVKQLQRLKENTIPVYVIAGSHDFSPSGKTMLDILEEANLIKDVTRGEVINNKLKLKFTTDPKTNIKITGILGKKGSLDKYYYEDLDRDIEQEPGEKIFMFHTSITELKPKELEKMESQPISFLPKNFNYYAGGHVHITNEISLDGYTNVVYPGPVFPASFSELEKLGAGFYCVIEDWKLTRKPINLKPIIKINIDANNKTPNEINNTINQNNHDYKDSLVLIKIKGELREGKVTEIDLRPFIETIYKKGAYFVMKNTNQLTSKEFEEVNITKGNTEDIEEQIIKEHLGQEPINDELEITEQLMQSLSEESQEGEKKYEYEARMIENAKKILERNL